MGRWRRLLVALPSMRKGVSPIVATILLIIIATVAGFLVWGYIHRVAAGGPTIKLAISSIDAVVAPDGSSATVSITLSNMGSVPIEIKNVTIVVGSYEKTFEPSTSIAPHASISLTFTINAAQGYYLEPGETVKVIVSGTAAHHSVTVVKYATLHT